MVFSVLDSLDFRCITGYQVIIRVLFFEVFMIHLKLKDYIFIFPALRTK